MKFYIVERRSKHNTPPSDLAAAATAEYGPASKSEIASNDVEVPRKNCTKIKILWSKFIIMAINQ